jgi:4-amino-4-deoxy-L-arabinose transferase-like glycosyltransferase
VGGSLLLLVGLHLYLMAGSGSGSISVIILGAAFIGLGMLGPWEKWAATARLAGWLGVAPAQIALICLGLAAAHASRVAAGDGPLVISRLAIPLWLLGIGLCAAGLWQPRSSSHQLQGWPRIEAIGLALLIACAFMLRSWGAGMHPYVLGGDEGSAGLTAWQFVTGTRNNLLSLGWFNYPALYFWLLSLSQRLLGPSVVAIRWFSALGGALAVGALYWAARSLYGRWLAIWSAVWLAAFPLHLFFSRLAYSNIWDGLFLMLAITGVWLAWDGSDRRGFLLAGANIGLGQFFYLTGRLIPVIILLWLIPLALQRPPDRRKAGGVAAMLLIAISICLPLLELYLAHPDWLLFSTERVSMLMPGWTAEAAHALGTTPLGLLAEQTVITALGLTIAEPQGIYAGSGIPLLTSISAVCFYLGLLFVLWHWRQPRFDWLLIVLASVLIVGGLSIEAPSSQRMLVLAPVLAIMIALPLETIRQRVGLRWRVWAGACLSLLIMGAAAQNLVFFFGDYLPRERYGSPNGEVAQGVVDLLQQLPANTVTYFIGGERMGFSSIPSIAYLLPQATGIDLLPPYHLPESALADGNFLVVVLPERQDALQAVQAQLSGLSLQQRYNREGGSLFYWYSPTPLPGGG